MSFKKAGKIVLISLSAIIFILTFAVVLAFFFIDNVIATYLKDRVAKASEGQYELHIGDIAVSYINQTIILDSVYVTTSQQQLQHAREINKKPLPELDLDFPLIKLIDLDVSQLLSGDVHFQNFFIQQPLISIKYEEERERSPSNFFENLKKMLPTIEAEKVLLDSGDIYYLKQGSIKILDIKDLSFLFKNFSTETFSLPSAFYPSQDLLLFLEGGMKYRKGPTIFTLAKLSSSHKYFLAEDIGLTTDSTGYDLTDRTIFNIKTPQVHGRLSDKKTGQRVLNLKSLAIVNPDIFVSIKKDRAKTIKDEVTGLSEIISPYMENLLIEDIQLTDADISYLHREKDFNTAYGGTDIYASIKNFHVDPDKGVDTTDILYAESFWVAVNGEFSMENKNQMLTAEKVVASTDTGLLVKDIHFLTHNRSSCQNLKEEPFISVNTPSLHIGFTEWERLTHGKSIAIPTVSINDPKIVVKGLKNDNEGGDPRKSIIKTVQRFVPYIRIATFNIEDASFQVQVCRPSGSVKIGADNLKLTLTDIKIDSTAELNNDRIFFAEKAIARLDKFNLNTENADVIVRNIYFNSEKGIFSKGLMVTADTKASDFRMEAPELIVNSSQWGRLVKGKSIFIPNILLKKPAIYFEASDGERDQTDIMEVINEAVPKTTITQIHIVNADATYKKSAANPSTLTAKDFELHLYKLNLPAENKDERILFAQNFKFSVHNYASFSKNLYRLDVDNLNASSWKGVTANGITLSTDSSAYLEALKTRNPTYYKVEVPEIKISYIDWAAMINGNGTETGITTVKSPVIQIIDKEEEHPPKESLVLFHEKVNKYWPWLRSKQLALTEGEILFSRIHQRDTSYYEAKDFDLVMKNIRVDSVAAESAERVLYAKNVKLEASDLKRKSSDGFHELTIDSLFAGTEKETLEAFNLEYHPQDSLDNLLQQQIPEQDFLRLSIPHLNVSNLNWNAFFEKGNDIIASYVTAMDIKMEVIRDRRFRDVSRENTMPHVWFRSLPADVAIDSLYFADAYIAYTENPGEELNPGTLWASDVDTKIINFNNAREKGRNIVLETEGQLMGAGDLSLSIHFDIFSNKNAFNYQGHGGSMDLTKLNPALERIAFLSVESGHLDSMDFHVDANEEHATGELLAYFDNLKIELLDKEPGLDDKDLKSFFANALVVNSENVPGDFNPGEIDYSWDKKNNYFNYVWKTFRSGIYSSLGVKKFKKIKEKAGKILPFI